MQNRYFGDVGDFGKYSLLSEICRHTDNYKITLGIVWYLFPDEGHNNDGGHISYLFRDDMRKLNPALFDFLRNSIDRKERQVSVLEKSRLFPSRTVFCGNPISVNGQVTKRISHRAAWFQECLNLTENCDVIFVDPDNGIEVASVTRRSPKAGKYIFWDEICAYLERDKSLVIYHHLNRTASVAEQMQKMKAKFCDVLPRGFRLIGLVFRRGSCRSYWLLLRNDIADVVESRIEKMLGSGWHSHFERA